MTPRDRLDALLSRFRARAAGCWKVSGDRLALEQVAFSAAADLPDEVGLGFSGATRTVPLVQADLGIVAAALAGEPVVSLAADLPPDSGSGLWLRRFGATRSVAVPLRGATGAVVSVVALALEGESPAAEVIVAAVRSEAAGWAGLP